jgi:hypothetical protein
LFESENSSDVLLHQKKYKVKTIVIPTLWKHKHKVHYKE